MNSDDVRLQYDLMNQLKIVKRENAKLRERNSLLASYLAQDLQIDFRYLPAVNLMPLWLSGL